MPHARRRLGDRGEQLAESFLAGHGYVVVERNYRASGGEIDLVCRDGDTLAFVEVKTRRGTAFGMPEEAVTAAKLAHIVAAAEHYVAERELAGAPWRVDVVAIELDTSGRLVEVRLVRDAADW
jgi:putative endonuclease